MRDYYEILMLHERAIPEVVEKAYRVLARKYHPDLYPPERKGWAAERMTEINVAYATIGDAKKRAEYDSQRRQRGSHWQDVDQVMDVGLRCFNHPKEASVTFCWWCGRPICEVCVDATQVHPRCKTCEAYLAKEAEATPPEAAWPWLQRKMGWLGNVVYYWLVCATVAGCLLAAAGITELLGGDFRHLLAAFAVLGLLFGVMLFRDLTWRVVCPACHHANGRLHFRASSPWAAFFAPHQACTDCGRWFLPEELRDAFR